MVITIVSACSSGQPTVGHACLRGGNDSCDPWVWGGQCVRLRFGPEGSFDRSALKRAVA
jgi:hypothetical protein